MIDPALLGPHISLKLFGGGDGNANVDSNPASSLAGSLQPQSPPSSAGRALQHRKLTAMLSTLRGSATQATLETVGEPDDMDIEDADTNGSHALGFKL